ncbi:unnamed protein product [Boreogadus saida]
MSIRSLKNGIWASLNGAVLHVCCSGAPEVIISLCVIATSASSQRQAPTWRPHTESLPIAALSTSLSSPALRSVAPYVHTSVKH